jgi:hypothetical protein
LINDENFATIEIAFDEDKEYDSLVFQHKKGDTNIA